MQTDIADARNAACPTHSSPQRKFQNCSPRVLIGLGPHYKTLMLIIYLVNRLILFGLGGGGGRGGKMAPPEDFDKYLKNGLTDLHQPL